MSKLHWSADSIVIRDNVVFGFGWMFHEGEEITNLRLFVRSPGNGAGTTIPVDYGKSRSDVAKAFEEHPTAQHSGFVFYGFIPSRQLENSEFFLEATFGTGEVVNVAFPRAALKNDPVGRVRDRNLMLRRQVVRGLELLREGKVSVLFGKIRKHLRDRPQSHLDSRAICDKLLSLERKNVVLLIDHSLGGGANLYSDRLISERIQKGDTVLTISYHVASLNYFVRICNSRITETHFIDGLSTAYELAKLVSIKELIYNNAVSFPRPDEVPNLMLAIKAEHGPPLTLTVHDFFMVCPSTQLIDKNSQFCGVPVIETCHQCLLNSNYGFVSLYSQRDIYKWRELWGMVIQGADKILVFSRSSEALLRKAYGVIDGSKILYEPHKVDYLSTMPMKLNVVDTLHIGVVGEIGFHKGAKFVRELSEEIKKRGGRVKISVIGSIDTKCDPSIVQQTGPYDREDLPKLIEESNVNVILFPSIWPETFSYVVHELVRLEVPVACFNMGAQAERIRTYHNGLILDYMDAPSVLDSLLAFHSKIYLGKRG